MKFPLVLSCGHLAMDGCNCNQKTNHVTEALDIFKGRWRETLTGYGMTLPSSPKKGAPCPICGGRDRFVFDDRDGRGTWHCRHCEPHAGGGLLLLSMYIGLSVSETAKELVGSDIRSAPISRSVQEDFDRLEREQQQKKEAAENAAIEAAFIVRNSRMSTHKYLESKKIEIEVQVRDGNIIVPMFKNKQLVNVQRISACGIKLFLKGGVKEGAYCAIKPTSKSKTIAIAEGYATSLSVNIVTGLRVFCAFTANNIPEIAKKVRMAYPGNKIIIFADRDKDTVNWIGGSGMHYAELAAKQSGCEICAPPTTEKDWDDHRKDEGKKKCLEMMKEALKNNQREQKMNINQLKRIISNDQ